MVSNYDSKFRGNKKKIGQLDNIFKNLHEKKHHKQSLKKTIQLGETICNIYHRQIATIPNIEELLKLRRKIQNPIKM